MAFSLFLYLPTFNPGATEFMLRIIISFVISFFVSGFIATYFAKERKIRYAVYELIVVTICLVLISLYSIPIILLGVSFIPLGGVLGFWIDRRNEI